MNHSALATIYDRIPITFEYGEGVWLFDKQKKAYIDGVAGIGVSAFGHNHPTILEAIHRQANKILFIGNMFEIEEQTKLAEELRDLTQLHQAVFVNSGAESSEVSIKMARAYASSRGVKNPIIIVFNKGFHGRTLGTLSASGNSKLQEGFAPLLPGFIFLPYNDINAVKEIAATNNPNIIGISLEPILGQGGVVVPDDDFLPQLRKICDEQDWLLMLDEIQTGVGRTGKFFAHQYHDGLKPDIMTTAKCLAGGLPIGVCIANQKVSETFTKNKHGTTFGGNPLSCYLARTVLQVIKNDNLLDNIQEVGAYLLDSLKTELSGQDGVVDIRGKGFMLGVELDRPCNSLYTDGIEAGVLFNITAERVVRILPPYIMTKDEANIFVERLKTAITSFIRRTNAQR